MWASPWARRSVKPSPIAKRLGQGLANGDPHILIGVVVIDVGVTAGTDLQIKQPVAADLMEHVIEEGHAGAHLALAAAIEPHAHLYIGFTGDPMHLSTAHADLLDALLMQQSSPRAQPQPSGSCGVQVITGPGWGPVPWWAKGCWAPKSSAVISRQSRSRGRAKR